MILNYLKKRYQSRDWIGIWYNILKSRGENDLISLNRCAIDDEGKILKTESFSFSHSLMDGTSAIPYYLKQFGHGPCGPRKMSHIKQFSLLEIFKLTFSTMKLSPINNTQWKFFTQQRITNIFEYAKTTMSVQQTNNFDKYCKSNKISENAVLLELFSKRIMPLIKNDDLMHTWLFPVNIRGMVQKNNDYANHTSFIPVNVDKECNARELHEQIKKELKSFKYIGRWWVHHISMIAPICYLKKLSLKASQTKFWLGSFSNVGAWTTDDSFKHLDNRENEAWFFATPGSKNFPISFVIMTLNGRMSFSLRIHPAICAPGESLNISNQILTELKSDINQLYS